MDLKRKIRPIYWKLSAPLQKTIYSLYSSLMKLLVPIIIVKIRKGKFSKKVINQLTNIKDAVDFAFSFQYLAFTLRTAQIKYEINKLLETLQDLKPKIILEIGTAGGGTFFLFTRIAHPKATLISVDLPGGAFGGGYAKWKIPIYKSFAIGNQKIKLLRADSHNPKILEEVKNLINNKMVDFLFIDADHTYEGVKKDFMMYSSLVRKGGIVALHDIVEHTKSSGCEVKKFWDEIKHDFEHLELIKDIEQTAAGIGIIYL
ncbi:MAG: class I SAM-dependent methyltransferase [Candidatus Thorarchaeota archaeon]